MTTAPSTTPLYRRVLDQDPKFGNVVAEYLTQGALGAVTVTDPALAAASVLAIDALCDRLGLENPDTDIDGTSFDDFKAGAQQEAAVYTGTTPLYKRLAEGAPQFNQTLAMGALTVSLELIGSKLDAETQTDFLKAFDAWMVEDIGITAPEEQQEKAS